jgi:ABC-type polar amino acid transport system ATPase subunit
MILISNLNKYFGQTHVLRDINLKVNNGEVVAILGPSGSGKSTLLRCINQLENIDYGNITIDDETVNPVKHRIGMVFQLFHLFPHLTVLENLTYAPIKVLKIPKEEAIKNARELLAKVGLADKENAYPTNLSGGQKQRAAIARTLMMQPKIILFDEPTSALDPEMVNEVLEVIQSFAHTGITIIIVTHEMSFAENTADRIIFMDKGEIVEDTTPKNFFSNNENERIKKFLSQIK